MIKMNELTVTINKDALLEQLQTHKERFVKSYEALVKVYKKKADKYQTKYNEYIEKKANNKLTKKDTQPQPPPEPIDRTETYKFYIQMIEQHATHHIELTERCFREL